MSNSLWHHGILHARFPLSFTISQSLLKLLSIESVIHPTISTSVAHISSCPQSFPALGSFPIRWLFASGGQRIGGSASVLPMNIQGSCPLGFDWFDLIAAQETLKSLLQHHSSKASIKKKSINSLALSLLHGPTLISIHDYWKNHSFLSAKWCLCFLFIYLFIYLLLLFCLCFLIHCLGLSQLSFQGASIF